MVSLVSLVEFVLKMKMTITMKTKVEVALSLMQFRPISFLLLLTALIYLLDENVSLVSLPSLLSSSSVHHKTKQEVPSLIQ